MKALIACSLTLCFCGSMTFGSSLGTAFTYQGHLMEGGNSANGLYDLRFDVFADSTNGLPVGTGVVLSAIPVTNGLFVAALDFGDVIFSDNARWLELSVRQVGSGSAFVQLTPRQPMTPAPFALQADRASMLASVSNASIELRLNGERALRLEPTASSPNIVAGFGGNLVSS